MSPAENYRNRRKREDYRGKKSEKQPKILSRKQQKALQKQEKKNVCFISGEIQHLINQVFFSSSNDEVQEQLPGRFEVDKQRRNQ